jgi:hypothetical protein
MKFDVLNNVYKLIFFCYLIYSVNSALATDFTHFTEDNSITSDYIYTPGEVFYGAYYFSNSGTILKDVRNGINVSPTNDVRKLLNYHKNNTFYFSAFYKYLPTAQTIR